MKNRTSLTLVISLLVCTLTAGTFAQTLPPEDSTLEARPSDLQSAQEENANDQCPYKVVSGDKVYLQIKNVKLRSDNLPLYPYFNVYGKNGEDWKYISGTSSQDGFQICPKVQYPSSFQFYIDNTYKDYYIDVHSKWFYGKQLVAKGVQFNTAPLVAWAKNPQNVGKIYPTPLEISKGNSITLKYDYSKRERYYYFEIVSYKITNLDNEYKKYLYEAYKTWLITRQQGVTDKWLYYYEDDKKYNSTTTSLPDYTEITQNRYDKTKREVLFPCSKNNKIVFSIENKTGALDTIELTTDDVVKQLNDCMKKYPFNNTKWVVKCISKQKSEIELSFAGIPRHYILDAIVIPLGNSIRANPVYGNGYAPKFYIEIFKKGETKPKKYWDKSQGWIVKLNIPEPIVVREGMGEEFTIKIEDWFVPPYTAYKGNKPIHTFLNLKDTDLKKQQLVQKLPLANLPSTAMKVQVHDMENQINNLDSLRLYLEIQK